MQPRDAAMKAVGGVKKGGVGISDGDGAAQMIFGERGRLQLRLEFDGTTCPDGPMTEQTTLNPQRAAVELMGRE